MIEFEWKASERLLRIVAVCNGLLLWDKFTSNERCALHELCNKGLIVVYYDKTNIAKAVKLTEKGLQEVFIDSL